MKAEDLLDKISQDEGFGNWGTVVLDCHHSVIRSIAIAAVNEALRQCGVSGRSEQLVCAECINGRDAFDPDWLCPKCRLKEKNKLLNKPIKLKGYKDAFTVKAKNRRFKVFKEEVDGKNGNIICITSLTSETGKKDGAITILSKNEKIKYSFIGLSDEAIKELYVCLHHYLKNVL